MPRFVTIFFAIVIGLSLPAVHSADLPVIVTTCSALTSSRTTLASGSSGTILFTCGSGPALTATHPGSAVPRFLLPNGYTLLTIIVHSSGATGCTTGSPLITGQEFTFSEKQALDYCALFSSPPLTGLASFSLNWSKS